MATPSAVESRQRWTRTPVWRTSARIDASAIVSAAAGIAGQAETRRNLAVVRDAVLAEMRVFARAARRGDRKSRRTASRAAALRYPSPALSACEKATHPASASSPISVSSTAGEPDGQRADRMDVRLVERASAVLQHLDQARLVERRIGVRRTGEARHPSGHRGVHFRFERGLVFEARLAQPRGKVDESGADDQSARVDRPFARIQPEGAAPIAATVPVGDVDGRDAIDAVLRDRSRGRR